MKGNAEVSLAQLASEVAGDLDAGEVVFGEGLTDLLALAIASPFPVITAPGTANAVACVGSWARGRRVLLALDNDESGRKAAPPTAAALYGQGATRVIAVTWPGNAKDACDVVAARGVVGLEEFLGRAPSEKAA